MQDLDARPAEDASAEQAFCAIAAACVGDLDRYLAEFMETASPEGPHKTRVALRRLTTALDAFLPLMRQAKAKILRRKAKDIFRRLGAVRDADVYHFAKDPSDAAAETAALRETVRAALRRRQALGFGPLMLRSLSDDTLLRGGEGGLRLRAAPASILASAAMDQAYAALRSHGKTLTRMDDLSRHEFRKDLKSLRYLTDFFADSKAQPDLCADLEALQDLLGTLNDIANARQREHKKRRRGKAEMAALKQADALWHQLRHAAPWWKRDSA
jgi:CHAD domain-containing protein